MRLLWAPVLCLGNVLASAIPPIKSGNSHRLRLPFVPSPDDLENGVRSSLSINWSIQNGSLYANQDQVYPPSTTMQLRAPLLEGIDQTEPSDKTVEVSYTLDSRPLSKDRVGSVAGMVRLRIEFLDLHGNLVSPNAVAVDLLTYQNGDHHITRVRVEPARGGDEDDYFAQTSRPWVVKYWRTQFGSIFDKTRTKTDTPVADSGAIAEPAMQNDDTKATTSHDAGSNSPLSSISSFWAAPAVAYPKHRSGHGHHNAHHGHRTKDFMKIFSPVLLPAVFGVAAGLVACLVGFVIGHLLMSLAARLGWQKETVRKPHKMAFEDEPAEKAPMVSHIYVTEVTEISESVV